MSTSLPDFGAGPATAGRYAQRVAEYHGWQPAGEPARLVAEARRVAGELVSPTARPGAEPEQWHELVLTR